MTRTPEHVRARALSALAACDTADLATRYAAAAGQAPQAMPMRGPEIGLVMLRGRVGGGGALFNLGEATVTRATMKLSTGEVGHAVVLGRDPEKARMVAHLDALRQLPEWMTRIDAEIVEPIVSLQIARRASRTEETEATRVDFFTLVRGSD